MKVRIFSDGASKGNPGPGGYGTIIKYYDMDNNLTKSEEFTEGFEQTTNNRMELLGVITGFKNLIITDKVDIEVITDSQYIVKAINDGWLDKWISNNWRLSNNQPVKNKDLWEILLGWIKDFPKAKFIWIRGHSGHPENERCDQLASYSANKIKLIKENGIYKLDNSNEKE